MRLKQLKFFISVSENAFCIVPLSLVRSYKYFNKQDALRIYIGDTLQLDHIARNYQGFLVNGKIAMLEPFR